MLATAARSPSVGSIDPQGVNEHPEWAVAFQLVTRGPQDGETQLPSAAEYFVDKAGLPTAGLALDDDARGKAVGGAAEPLFQSGLLGRSTDEGHQNWRSAHGHILGATFRATEKGGASSTPPATLGEQEPCVRSGGSTAWRGATHAVIRDADARLDPLL